MKINVRVIFDKREVEYEIPVGMGDKTFKWLGMVTCNRFSDSSPNGALRRRDPVRRGLSDKATHQPVEMALPDGQIPHPSAYICDFLNDGDEVKIHLVDVQELRRDDGTPTYTKWSKLAFVNTSKIDDESIDEASLATGGDTSEGDRHYTAQQQKGRAQFMRILMKSQIPDAVAIGSQVKSCWSTVSRAMPKLDEKTTQETQKAFSESWEMLSELFDYYGKLTNGPVGRLPKEGFYKMLSEASIFPEETLNALYVRVFDRACQAADKGEATLSLGGLLVALILCAQTKYNDTYSDEPSVAAGEALEDMLQNYLSKTAERCEMRSMLKANFVSSHTLNQIREWHDELFAVFNKYAGRSRELPSSISYKDFTDCLYDANLTEATETDTKGNPISFEYDTVADLLTNVRSGLIIGRPEAVAASEGKKSDLPDDVIPDDEFTYPEMVEAICRHSFNKYRGTKPDEETGQIEYFDYIGDLSVVDCFVKGLVMVIGTLNVPNPK